MKKLTILTILALLALTASLHAQTTAAAPQKAVYMAPLTWRADGQGQYKFDGAVGLTSASIARDGSVYTDSSQGICELEAPYATDGLVYSMAANWEFTGAVTMEVSTTGKAEDYAPITNGVPLDYQKFLPGSQLKWRATLAPNSSLTELKIVYTDLSGVVGSFGNPDLSGFAARKEIFIKGSPDASLYNFQVQIRVYESKNGGKIGTVPEGDCPIFPSQSDMLDIRFTQADGETSLPYYRERVSGSAGERVAVFWVKIPEIPQTGLPLYIYYGKQKADDLSDANKVFDFYDDFTSSKLDSSVWSVTLQNKTSQASVSGSLLSLDGARVTTLKNVFGTGVIEYRAKVASNGAIVGIIAPGASEADDLSAYASITASQAHCIIQGGKVMANDPKMISPDTFYDFRIISDNGNITFQRYADGWGAAPQANVTCTLTGTPANPLTGTPIGLSVGLGGTGLYCDWIRVRKTAATLPQVDINKTAAQPAEAVDLPNFNNLTLAPDGSLVIASPEGAKQSQNTGDYTSSLIKAPFQARILTPSWNQGSGDRVRGSEISISISTDGGKTFVPDWQSGVAKYASKKDFAKGDQLRWQAKFQGSGDRVQGSEKTTNRLTRFALAYSPGTITVVQPKGGEQMIPGSQYNILWHADGYDPSYNMNLYYSDDGGTTYQPIAAKIANSGSYAWSVPQDDSVLVSVMVADSLDKTVYGVSSGSFTISANAVETVQGSGVGVQGSEVKQEAIPSPVIASETKPSEATPSDKEKEGKIGKDKAVYEILVKLGDNAPANPKEDTGGFFKEGDIVMVRPSGYNWSNNERRSFLIVKAYLTAQQAQEIVAPQADVNKDRKGNIRKYKLDLVKHGLLDKKVEAQRGLMKTPPLVIDTDIEAKQ